MRLSLFANLSFIPHLQDLAAKEWPARVSAVKLLSSTYGVIESPSRGQLRQVFVGLCEDDTPMVRRAAAQVSFTVCFCRPLVALSTTSIDTPL